MGIWVGWINPCLFGSRRVPGSTCLVGWTCIFFSPVTASCMGDELETHGYSSEFLIGAYLSLKLNKQLLAVHCLFALCCWLVSSKTGYQFSWTLTIVVHLIIFGFKIDWILITLCSIFFLCEFQHGGKPSTPCWGRSSTLNPLTFLSVCTRTNQAQTKLQKIIIKISQLQTFWAYHWMCKKISSLLTPLTKLYGHGN